RLMTASAGDRAVRRQDGVKEETAAQIDLGFRQWVVFRDGPVAEQTLWNGVEGEAIGQGVLGQNRRVGTVDGGQPAKHEQGECPGRSGHWYLAQPGRR